MKAFSDGIKNLLGDSLPHSEDTASPKARKKPRSISTSSTGKTVLPAHMTQGLARPPIAAIKDKTATPDTTAPASRQPKPKKTASPAHTAERRSPPPVAATKDTTATPDTTAPAPTAAATAVTWGPATPSRIMTPEKHPRLQLTLAEINVAREYIKRGELDLACAVLHEADRKGPPHVDVYRLLGEVYFQKQEWRKALKLWYQTSAMAQRTNERLKSQIHRKIMRCNAQLALEELQAGDRIKAAEHISFAVAAVDYSIYLKVRRDMIDPIVAYIRQEMEQRGAKPVTPSDQPLNIVICMDVIKMSAVHSHKHLYVSLAAALTQLDPRIRVTIIATYERLINWNAGLEDYYRPDNIEQLKEFITEKVPEGLRERISVQYFESFGLRGVINTCQSILDMQPDLVLYGGGRNGYHANESVLVRHVLYRYLPTAFFFVQSNNTVDEVNDVIIPRGAHPLEGAPGNAEICPAPYPPFPGLQAAVVPESLSDLPSGRKRIVTAWVGVRLDLRLHSYTPEQLDMIMDMIDSVPDADWHLIGAEKPKELLAGNARFKSLRDKKRIVVHPVLDYDEFYHMTSSATLFFQPPGITGGGGGASIARNNNVPIICFEHSDVAPLQPSAFVFREDDLRGGLDAAFRVLTDPNARQSLIDGQIMLRDRRRGEAPAKFYSAMTQAVSHFKSRLSAGWASQMKTPGTAIAETDEQSDTSNQENAGTV